MSILLFNVKFGNYLGGCHPNPQGTEGQVGQRERGGLDLGEAVHGQLGPDGVYVLKVGDRVGAPPGWYRVSVHAFPPPQEQKGPPEPLGDPRYHDHEKSGILIEVVEKPAEGAYNIDIKP